MRRHLASCTAVIATATASLGLCAGAAAATSSTTSGHAVTSASGLATSSGARASVAAAPAKKPTTTTKTPAPSPAPSKTTPTPTPAPPAPPATGVKATARLFLPDAFFVHKKTLITPGRGMHVIGEVVPYVPGQTVTFKVFLGRKVIKKQTLQVKLSPNKKYGRFTTVVKAPKPGILRLQVVHARTAQMLGFTSSRGVASLNTHVSFGARGAFVQLLQQKLAAVHMYIPQSGVYDEKTGLAIDAYHRLLRHGTSQSLDGLTVSELLAGRGSFPVRYPKDGRHAEGNLGLQLLALIDHGKVEAIYPISSGKPSTPTILGRFHVYLRTPGYLPDGMYYSDFFTGGYAVHGYDPAPDYPASHGCMRLPITDAISVWNWLAIGVGVDVYY
jgi:L,D-transpeptidase catalytic domain